MTNETGYQGWTNRATWCVSLHAGNTEPWYKATTELAARAVAKAPEAEQVREGIWTVEEAERITLADWLKDWTEHALGLGTLGSSDTDLFRSDMLSGYLSDVNWREWAEHLLSDVDRS